MSDFSTTQHAILRWAQTIATPSYVLDVAALKRNLGRAAEVKREAGCKILLATKAFALPAAFPIMREVLDGTTASGEYEARLGHDEFGKEVHVYSPAYAPGEVERLTKLAQHIYFNSPQQIIDNLPVIRKHPGLKIGIRINPGYSTRRLAAPCTIHARRTRDSARRARCSTPCLGTRSTSCTRMRCGNPVTRAPSVSSSTWDASSAITFAG